MLRKISLGVVSTSSPQESSKKRVLVVDSDSELPVAVSTSVDCSQGTARKRFRTVSIDVWRKKCQDAANVYDDALPSLEEASRLFGFTSA